MKQYKELITHILENGKMRKTRNGHSTISCFDYTMKFDLRSGFPMQTTKQLSFHNIYWELIWFLRGDTNIRFLLDKNVNIWNGDAYRVYIEYAKNLSELDYSVHIDDPVQSRLRTMTKQEFVHAIKTDDEFCERWGNLGKIYGYQWRNLEIDQIRSVIDLINNDPTSRRIIIDSWNVEQLGDMALPPCHTLAQFYVDGEYLDCTLYQRSGDTFLGVPYNIASYALLLSILANITGKTPRHFNHHIGDAHIYVEHIKQCNVILSRDIYDLPKLHWTTPLTKLEDIINIKKRSCILHNYKSHSIIKGKLLV